MQSPHPFSGTPNLLHFVFNQTNHLTHTTMWYNQMALLAPSIPQPVDIEKIYYSSYQDFHTIFHSLWQTNLFFSSLYDINIRYHIICKKGNIWSICVTDKHKTALFEYPLQPSQPQVYLLSRTYNSQLHYIYFLFVFAPPLSKRFFYFDDYE